MLGERHTEAGEGRTETEGTGEVEKQSGNLLLPRRDSTRDGGDALLSASAAAELEDTKEYESVGNGAQTESEQGIRKR